jgi:hypothetical protein
VLMRPIKRGAARASSAAHSARRQRRAEDHDDQPGEVVGDDVSTSAPATIASTAHLRLPARRGGEQRV